LSGHSLPEDLPGRGGTRKPTVNQGMETGVVRGLDQMRQFVDDDVFQANLGKGPQLRIENQTPGFRTARPPSGTESLDRPSVGLEPRPLLPKGKETFQGSSDSLFFPPVQELFPLRLRPRSRNPHRHFAGLRIKKDAGNSSRGKNTKGKKISPDHHEPREKRLQGPAPLGDPFGPGRNETVDKKPGDVPGRGDPNSAVERKNP
jgi:hypothetical protein